MVLFKLDCFSPDVGQKIPRSAINTSQIWIISSMKRSWNGNRVTVDLFFIRGAVIGPNVRPKHICHHLKSQIEALKVERIKICAQTCNSGFHISYLITCCQ